MAEKEVGPDIIGVSMFDSFLWGKNGNKYHFECLFWWIFSKQTGEYLEWKIAALTSAWAGQRKTVTTMEFVKSLVPDFEFAEQDGMREGEGMPNRLAILCSASYAGLGDHAQN